MVFNLDEFYRYWPNMPPSVLRVVEDHVSEMAERIVEESIQKRQDARFRYYRERDGLVKELTDRGYVANVTLDGSVIITGRRP